MTVSAAPALAGPFDGNDVATTFPFDFKIFADSDLRVVLRDALSAEYLLTLGVDYSVSMNPDQNADPGGSITYPLSGPPLATGERLTVTTDLELSQQTVFTNLGKFFPATVEDTFDRVVMLLRQIQAEGVRAIRVPVSLSDVLTDLPTPVPGAGLVWNEDGTAIVNGIPTESLIAISSFMSNVIQAVDAAEARSDIGAAADAEVGYLTRRGIPDWDATETYMIGDRIIGDDGKTYRSLIDNNTAQTPSSSPTRWEPWALTRGEVDARLADAFMGANQSLSASGYQKLPGGVILQWGEGASNASGQLSVTFPIAFTSGDTAYRIVGMHSGTGAAMVIEHFWSRTLTGTRLDIFDTSGQPVNGVIIRWFAIGL